MTEARYHRRLLALPALAAILLLCVFLTPASAGERVALVIGNGTYQHAPLLANPGNDAADVGAALGRLGFQVTRIENAGYSELRRGLQQFALAASASEVAVVFYAGHGIEVDKRNYLVPVDAQLLSDRDVDFEAVPMELLSRAVDRARGLRLIILDACRDNPFVAAMQRTGATRSIGRGLARFEPSGETLVAYAAAAGTVAADGEGRNSPYTTALLAHLEEPGLEVGLLFRKVRDGVLAATGGRQEPFVYGSLSSKGAYLAALPEPGLEQPETTAKPTQDAKPEPVAPGPDERLSAEELAAERVFWESIKDSEDAADFEAYLKQFRGGTYEALARNRLKRLVPSPPPEVATLPPSNNEPASTASQDRQRLPKTATWETRNDEWSIWLTKRGDKIFAILKRVSGIAELTCTGKINNAKRVESRCRGPWYSGVRLEGIFPNLRLSGGVFPGQFAFDPNNYSARE